MKEKCFYLTKKKREKTLLEITKILRKQRGVVFAYIHGTFLTSETMGFRDIDIALYLEKFKGDVFDHEQKIADFLEKNLKYPVDVRILNKAPFYFLNSVFREGHLLFSRDNSLLAELIEKSSRQAIINYNFSLQSLKELIS